MSRSNSTFFKKKSAIFIQSQFIFIADLNFILSFKIYKDPLTQFSHLSYKREFYVISK